MQYAKVEVPSHVGLEAVLDKLRVLTLLSLALTLPCCALPLSCPPAATSSVESPKELRGHHGRLKVTLVLRNSLDAKGQMQYCYLDQRGDRSPTLRLHPGDLLELKLKNKLTLRSNFGHEDAAWKPDCTAMAMNVDATNLHFHGLSISPSCHADDSLHTFVPASKTFTYRFRIPQDQAPGLYWYHPHVHGYSEEQILGGASGALIIEGIANANPEVAGLPERVLVIRDQGLESPMPNATINDPRRPAKDLSVNFIPIPYPNYPVPIIAAKPGQRELWRVLNASADTYVNLGVLFNGEWGKSGLVISHGSWQQLGLVALDGEALSNINGKTEIPIPPGGRAEFIITTPPEGMKAELITAGAETSPPEDEDKPDAAPAALRDDDNTPPRPLARIVSSASALEPPALREPRTIAADSKAASLAAAAPVRQRRLYFSEKIIDHAHPQTSTIYYITEEGHKPSAFDPSNLSPDIVVHQGDVEDWTVENRSTESHVFHIHQSHFLLLERDSVPVDEKLMLDTVDVPYWDGTFDRYPSVKLRMDFRDPNIAGTFPYHCHIQQHLDGGMIQVLPAPSASR
jgi:FtsP/CotA-like multicopper oxidase with cupredoxin domain